MPDRPNIILITTDQQRFDTIAWHGNRSIFTPHLNWLARQGVSYTRCYSDSPICVAARNTIMTGRHGYTNGLTSNSSAVRPMEQHPTLPGVLTDHGYQTRAVGKMHFTPTRCHYGFEHMQILEDYYRWLNRLGTHHRAMDHGIGQNEMEPTMATVPESLSLTHWTVDRSIDFLETRDPTRPFFMWTSFSKPHPPWDCDPKYWQLYDGMTMPEPVRGDWASDPDTMPRGMMQPTYSLNAVNRFGPQQVAAARRAYYACISQIDYNLGILFGRLREMRLLDNTWIIFASDHGEMLGDHGMGAKCTALEGSAHVPMLIRPPTGDWTPHAMQQTTCDRLVCLADIMPTCLNWAGVDQPEGIDGLDLLDQAAGKAQRDTMHVACTKHFGLIEGDDKYVYTALGNGELLFNLADDPMETRDLIRGGQAAEPHRRLRQRMIEFLTGHMPDAVKDGQLVGTDPAPTEADVAGMAWPGLHTTNERADVLH